MVFFTIQKQYDVKYLHSFEPAYWFYYYSNKSGCSMSLNMLYCSLAWTFYRKIEGKCARSMANAAIVVSQQRRRHSRVNGFRRWWRTIAGRQLVVLPAPGLQYKRQADRPRNFSRQASRYILGNGYSVRGTPVVFSIINRIYI